MNMKRAAMHLDSELEEMEKDKKVNQIESVVQEFWCTDHSKGGDMNVLQRWFTDLGIGWVLHLADGASSGTEELEHARSWSWMLALATITDTTSRSDFLFARFIQVAMSKMLTFVDSIANEVFVMNGSPVSYLKLSTLLGVQNALSEALSEIQLMFSSPPSAEVGRIES
jgi:hypothetical protein